MDVPDSPERNPCSPEEEDQQLSDEEVLKESGSERELDGEGGQGSLLGEEEEAGRALSRAEEEENHSDEEDRLSEAKSQESDTNEQGVELKSPRPRKGEEEDRTNDLEVSSVTRELDEHELDYDEEVPEEPSAAPAEEDGEKAAGEDDEEEEKGDDAPEDEKKSSSKSDDEKDGQDPLKEKKKEEDDGEIDDGEIDDDDLEEGEVKDPNDRKVRPRPTCRFFMKGHCTWGMNCRFIHPGVNDKGNYSLISKPEPFSPNGAPPMGPHPLMPANPWGGPVVDEILPPPPPDPPTESAWERGLRHAKEVLKKATMRKEQEPDFEEKRFTVTIGEDEREFDKENEFFRDWNYRITRDVRDPALDPYADPYYDYEIERFWRGGQYENFRVQYTDPDPYRNYRVRHQCSVPTPWDHTPENCRFSREKSVKKLTALPVPQPLTKITAAAPEAAKAGDNREARRKERQTRTPPRRSLSVSSVSSVSSASSSSSSVRSADSEDMYADLASPVSSASSRSPTPAQQKKGKSKKEDSAKEEKRKRDVPAQLLKSAKPTPGSKSQQLPQGQQPSAPQAQQGSFSGHKEIKLTLLNKAADKGSRKRYEPADKERPSSPPAKRANLSPDRGSRDRKAAGRPSSPKQERQRGQNPKPSPAQADRKRQLSPQSKSSSKVTSVPGKGAEPGPGAAKGGKSSTLSRREELLKQLKAVEDAIARKRAKIPGKV
uniref:C3H1-type domain-containing protein n=1 Tax=Zonotrichia albicollis TaxID=44394 RepID=A0A8D2MU16_ZONAL